MIERFNLAVFVHGKYIYNFCRSWSKAESCLISELKQCHRIGARGVVIHQGKNCGKGKEALTREQAKRKFVDNVTSVAEKFYRLFPDSGVKIILENSARQGTELGYSLDELAEIYQLIPDRLKCRFQFCIDTCHAFVAGEIDFRLPEVVDDWFKRFDRLIGLGKLALIHLNDSKIDWNGRADRHENLFAGYIGESFKESFSVLEGLARRGIPLVTETPTTDRLTELNQLKLLLNVHSPVRSNSD